LILSNIIYPLIYNIIQQYTLSSPLSGRKPSPQSSPNGRGRSFSYQLSSPLSHWERVRVRALILERVRVRALVRVRYFYIIIFIFFSYTLI